MTDDPTAHEAADPPQEQADLPAGTMPEARLGRGFFSPPDVSGEPTPAYEYPESASPFYTAALESLELSDASGADDGGALTELFEMLDEGDEPRAHPTPIEPAAVQAPPPVEPMAAPPAPPAVEPTAAPPAPSAGEPEYAAPPVAPAPAPPPAAWAEPPAPSASPLEPAGAADEQSAPAAVRIPAPVAPCGMCGMTVPVDPERGRCHLGHRLDGPTQPPARKGRLGR